MILSESVREPSWLGMISGGLKGSALIMCANSNVLDGLHRRGCYNGLEDTCDAQHNVLCRLHRHGRGRKTMNGDSVKNVSLGAAIC